MRLGDYDFNLSHGAHKPGEREACVMEAAGVKWLMRHGWSFSDAWAEINDHPACTDPVVFRAAQVVNDNLTDDGLLRMELRVDRLIAAHTPTDPETAHRARVRVLCWAARSVLHLVDESRREAALAAIETAEAWLRGEATREECAATAATATKPTNASAAAAAAVTYTKASAASAAASDSDSAAYAANALAVANAVRAVRDDMLLDWLDELLDQWDKARAAEGCLTDDEPVPTQTGGS